jgi:hypothetical protein
VLVFFLAVCRMPTSAISPKLHDLLLKLEFRRVILSRFAFRGSACAPASLRYLNRFRPKFRGKSAGFRVFPRLPGGLPGGVSGGLLAAVWAKITLKAVEFSALQPNIAGSHRL